MKKLIVSSEDLKPVLKKLAHVFNPKTHLPALTNVLVKATEGHAELIVSDLEHTIAAKIKADDIESSFDVLIPFVFFRKVIDLSGDAPITIELLNNKLRIFTDQDVYELKSLANPEDFLKVPAVPRQNELHLQPDFIDWVIAACLTVSGDENRPAMNCVCLDIKKEIMLLVSTDAHCLFKHRIDGASEVEDQLLIPVKLTKILEGMADPVLTWNTKMLCIKVGDYTVWSRRQEHKFPDYQVIIPKTGENVALRHSSLSLSLQKASLSTAEVKKTHFEFLPGNVLRMLTQDFGTERMIKVDIPANFEGEISSFYVNAEKLSTMLEQIEVEDLRLHVDTSSKAILLSSPEDPDYLGLIMPLYD